MNICHSYNISTKKVEENTRVSIDNKRIFFPHISKLCHSFRIQYRNVIKEQSEWQMKPNDVVFIG